MYSKLIVFKNLFLYVLGFQSYIFTRCSACIFQRKYSKVVMQQNVLKYIM